MAQLMSTWLVGAYTADMDGAARGIENLNSRPDGSLQPAGLAVTADSPSFVLTDADSVYAVAEGAGELVAFSRGSGNELVERGRASAGGEAPCHVGVYGDVVIVSNYVSGTLGVLTVDPLELVQVLDAEGGGPHEVQDGPHAHSTVQLVDGSIVSADLGADRLHVHSLQGTSLTRIRSVELRPGTGPRDVRQLASTRVLVLGELSNEVLLLDASLRVLATTTIPGAQPGDHAAGISVWGDFVYVTLRGSNRIGVLCVDGDELVSVTDVSSEGDGPRHHVIDGDVLHVANQLSSTVASFRIDEAGIPRIIAKPTPVFSPTYLARF